LWSRTLPGANLAYRMLWNVETTDKLAQGGGSQGQRPFEFGGREPQGNQFFVVDQMVILPKDGHYGSWLIALRCAL
jgi:hypothetical protein